MSHFNEVSEKRESADLSPSPAETTNEAEGTAYDRHKESYSDDRVDSTTCSTTSTPSTHAYNTGSVTNSGCFSRIICDSKLTYEEARKGILNAMPGWRIAASFSAEFGFVFSMLPESLSKNDYVLGGFYSVSFAGEINGYSPVMNPEEFKEIMRCPIEP